MSRDDDDIELFGKSHRPMHGREKQHDNRIDEEASNRAIVSQLGSNGKDPLSSQTNAWSPDGRDDLEFARPGTAHIGLTKEVEVITEENS